jgi:hypothetical protein
VPLQKLLFKPGVNRENTRYTTEGGFYDGDKVRFRQGTPEKIGGWVRISANNFVGVCRSLWSWATLAGQTLLGLGTNLKFYIQNGGAYYDITPIRATNTLTNPFGTTANSSTVLVTDTNGGFNNNDFVTFYSTSAAVGSVTILGEYQISRQSSTTYNITLQSRVTISIANPAVFTAQYQLANNTKVVLSTTDVLPAAFTAGTTYYVVNTSGYTFQLSATLGGSAISTFGQSQSGYQYATAQAQTTNPTGGGTVYASYQINTGPAEYQVPLVGWGAGTWGQGTWGNGGTTTNALQLWNQNNFGQDLVYGPRGGGIYYWNSSIGYNPLTLNSISNASPAVLTFATGTVPANGTVLTLSTTGTLPTGLLPGTNYYVINATSTTCNLSATYNGSAINTSSAGSGTHFVSPRGILISSLGGADGYAPLYQNFLLVSDASRFLIVFGTNDVTNTTLDPMLIRWSNQESLTVWYPAITNQAGSVRLSHGSKIITAMQNRQEIVVWTDASVYSLQYLGPPVVWGSQLLGDNISIVGPNATALASGVVYWMGYDKFYKYDGRIQTQSCDLRQYIFQDINSNQYDQIFASTNEGFNEVWWFYCSANSNTVDKYVVYNYLENIWYYGTMARTAWIDSGLNQYPIAATYSYNLVNHEDGVDDVETATALPIDAYITSSEFDIGDGHQFGFIWRVLPDITFRGSTIDNPQVTMSLYPLQNSGSGYNTPLSVGGVNYASVTRTAVLPIEKFTGQIYTRVRGRQMAFKVESNQVGTTWQLGAPRIDIKPDGRRGA